MESDDVKGGVERGVLNEAAELDVVNDKLETLDEASELLDEVADTDAGSELPPYVLDIPDTPVVEELTGSLEVPEDVAEANPDVSDGLNDEIPEVLDRYADGVVLEDAMLMETSVIDDEDGADPLAAIEDEVD